MSRPKTWIPLRDPPGPARPAPIEGRPSRGRMPFLAGTALALLPAQAAFAQEFEPVTSILGIGLHSAVGSSVFLGLVVFTAALAIQSVRERRGWADAEKGYLAEIERLRANDDRAKILLGAERQILITWSGASDMPTIEGDPTLVDETGHARRILAFGSWLIPADAGRIEAFLAPLRERGEAFRATLRTTKGRFVEAEGRTSGGQALLRLRDVSDERSSHLEAEAEGARARQELDTLRRLLDAIDQPLWLRDVGGNIVWTNQSYGAAMKSADSSSARPGELLDKKDREAAAACRALGKAYRGRVTAVMADARRVLDVIETPLSTTAQAALPSLALTGGTARDVSEIESLQAELGRLASAHARLLDDLPIAVATFDGRQRLVFHNAAYRQLWGLEAAFLDSKPSDGEILDRLRGRGLLPEQADFRKWREAFLENYRSVEPNEIWWHLPDRRTLRVVTNPNPQGGLTYLFDDVSDRMDLESRMNALTRTQRETLDTLAEGVALFGQDGRLKLFNRAFAELWRLPAEALERSPHIDSVVELCRALAPAEGPWADISSAVSGLQDIREGHGVRMGRQDGSHIDTAVAPLPGGSTLLTFADVSVQVDQERVLKERNEALELAARIRKGFVHHVSSELRWPLTNIIGFAELLGAETVGPLNERQREYAEHITRSSGTLLAIINDILDLASIDTETIELSRERVDIRTAVEAAAEGIKDRLVESKLQLEIDVPSSIGSFTGDTKRVRQVVYNLLSNAAGFSSPGQTIRVAARKTEDAVVISVSDQGRGIAPDMQGRVFDRFEADNGGTKHRGVGLGLSIVRSFVELHGGRVELVSEREAGTTVTCYFPADGHNPNPHQLAASMPAEDRGTIAP